MKSPPMVWKLRHLLQHANSTQAEIDGEWVPARPLRIGALVARFRCAWGVFTGRWDAVEWPKGQ